MPEVEPIPTEYPRLSPYLAVDDGVAAIEFYRDVLGATERLRLDGPEGRIGHAELEFGDSLLMLADEFVEAGNQSPKTLGGTAVTLSLYVEDVDAVHARALGAGATELRAPADQFYGDRTAGFEDPFGHRWFIASRIEDVSPEEMQRRATTAQD
jgi:PhnB protein